MLLPASIAALTFPVPLSSSLPLLSRLIVGDNEIDLMMAKAKKIDTLISDINERFF